METSRQPFKEPTYQPTPSQLLRDKELRRRNRLYIYLPFGITIFIATLIVILILIGIFAPGIMGTEAFIAAVADIIVILWILPMIAMLSILPIGFLAYLVNRRNKRKLHPETGPLAYRSKIQILLWRVQYFIEKTERKTTEVAPKIAQPVTQFNGFLAYLEQWWQLIARNLKRENDHE